MNSKEFNSLPVETQKMFRDAEKNIIDAFMIPKSWLPESYKGKRSHRKLSSVVSEAKRRKRNMFRDGREVSVKFDNSRDITSATPDRLEILNKYAADVAAGREIEFEIDELKQYKIEMAFVEGMIRTGLIDADDLDTE